MVKIVDLKGEWAVAIGRAFVAFGSIEHVTVACLREIPRDRIQRSAKSLRLAARIDLIVELLEAHSGEHFDILAEKLKSAKTLALTRNLIAHNPLVLDIYEQTDGSYLYRERITSLQKEQSITLVELQGFSFKAEALASELYSCSTKVFQLLNVAGGK